MKKRRLARKQILENNRVKKKEDRDLVIRSRRSMKKISDFNAGEVIVFKYDAITKDTLDKYDKSPLLITLGTFTAKKTKNFILQGINMHWLSRSQKTKVFDIIVKNYMKLDWTTGKNLRLKKKRFIQMTFDDIKANSILNKAIIGNNAYRHYIIKRGTGYRRVPLNFYDKLFTKEGRNVHRARWSHKSKGHKVKGY